MKFPIKYKQSNYYIIANIYEFNRFLYINVILLCGLWNFKLKCMFFFKNIVYFRLLIGIF